MCEPKSVPAHHGVFVHGSVVDDQNVESEGLSFVLSWELKLFLLSHAHELREENVFLHFRILAC